MNLHCVNRLVCGILLGQPELTKINTNQDILGVENTHFGTDVLSVKTGLCLTNCLLLGGSGIALGVSPVEKASSWEALFLSGIAVPLVSLCCVKTQEKDYSTVYAGAETNKPVSRA